MTSTPLCWKCGTSLEAQPLPLSRRADCPACHTELHVCRMCEFYDPRTRRHCREPVAEDVKDTTRANFCGYFRIQPNAYQAPDSMARHTTHVQLDALFGQHPTTPETRSDAEVAREQLEKLFGGDDKQKK